MIIPAFNEEHRFNSRTIFDEILAYDLDVIFIDDGSTDNTYILLSSLISELKIRKPNKNFELLRLVENVGKANVLREGLLYAITLKYDFAILQDMDFPYSNENAISLMNFATRSNYLLVSGARINLLGWNIKRKVTRHWIGRFIATYIATIVGVKMYDPQTPCKIYNLKLLKNSYLTEFRTRWFSDVELIKRLPLELQNSIYEFPMKDWRDVPEGHLKIISFPKILMELIILLTI